MGDLGDCDSVAVYVLEALMMKIALGELPRQFPLSSYANG